VIEVEAQVNAELQSDDVLRKSHSPIVYGKVAIGMLIRLYVNVSGEVSTRKLDA
jgi:hypothetical protein